MKVNLWIVLLVLSCLYFLYLVREDIIQNKELEREKFALEAGIKAIEAENASLKKAIEGALSEKRVERLARERLNLIKKGETAFKVCQ